MTQDLKAHSCLMGSEIGKMLFVKTRVSVNMRGHYVIALRKGKQEEESNFKQLLLLQAEDDKVLQRWIGNSYDKQFRMKYYKSWL